MIVDTREPDVIHNLMKKLPDYEAKELPTGDLFEPKMGLLFERKEYSDLVDSVYSKHLNKQLLEMNSTPYTCFMVVVGSLKDYQTAKWARPSSVPRRPSGRPWDTGNHYGLVMSKVREFPKIHWLWCENNHQLLTLVEKALLKFADTKKTTVYDTELMQVEKLAVSDPRDIQVRMLTAIPDVGIATATAIIERVGNVRNVLGMSVEELQDIQDIGELTAKKIYSYLHDC
mgnify:CR=1 FL=1